METAAYDGLIQTDGKLLAVGTFALDSPPFYAVRYNTNGTLDTSFNTTARLYAAIGGTDSAYVSLLFPDASMGVYGPAGGYAAIGVLRFDASGGIELNSTFSTSGKGIYAGTLQTNGHAVLVGDNTPEPFFTRLGGECIAAIKAGFVVECEFSNVVCGRGIADLLL